VSSNPKPVPGDVVWIQVLGAFTPAIVPQPRGQGRLATAVGARDHEQRWIHSAGRAANRSIRSARNAAIFEWTRRGASWFRVDVGKSGVHELLELLVRGFVVRVRKVAVLRCHWG
jgi:hypothetical protein